MRYSIHITGRNAPKFTVPAKRAVLAGDWDETAGEIVTPDRAAIRDRLPTRWRKAFDRGGSFWHDKACRFNGFAFTGNPPHMSVADSRGRPLFTVYALPMRDAATGGATG
jgi:hypothetical protein